MISDWHYFSGGKYIKNSEKNAQNFYIFSFIVRCSHVNSCIIGCKDIFGQVFQTNVYIVNFQGVETMKITWKLPLTTSREPYAWVWVRGLIWFSENFSCFHELIDFCNISLVVKSRNVTFFGCRVRTSFYSIRKYFAMQRLFWCNKKYILYIRRKVTQNVYWL